MPVVVVLLLAKKKIRLSSKRIVLWMLCFLELLGLPVYKVVAIYSHLFCFFNKLFVF